jgi:CRISPR-associated exonuclease Cas4
MGSGDIAEKPAGPSITITHVLEHLYCPRFTYFEHVLTIPERQERRWKVQKGRQVHLERQKVNKSYLRKKLGVTAREFDVPLASETLGVRGIADEVLTLDDGTLAPLDYKFAKKPRRVFRNQRMQSVLYGMLIEEVYQRPVNRGYLCYTRTNYEIVQLAIDARARRAAERAVREVLGVIQQGYLPQATRWKNRCGDCCYRNICIQ